MFKPTGLSIETDLSGECWTESYVCLEDDLVKTNPDRNLKCDGIDADLIRKAGADGYEVESVEIANMCKDNECDDDNDLSRCQQAKEAGIYTASTGTRACSSLSLLAILSASVLSWLRL
jgi:hypothetical protein